MALKLFWSVSTNSDTLQSLGTQDYTAGDSAAGNFGSPSFYSTNGIGGGYAYGAAANTQFGKHFSLNAGGSLIPSAPSDGSTACSNLVYSFAFNKYYDTGGPVKGFRTTHGHRLMQNGSTLGIWTALDSGGNTYAIRVENGTNSANLVEISAPTLSANQWYGIVGRVDFPNSKAKLEIYTHDGTTGGTPTLSQSNEATGSNWGSTYGFIVSTGTGAILFGTQASTHPSYPAYFDNVFVADTYDEPLQNYLTISSYQDYGASTPKGRLLLNNYVGVEGVTLIQGV